MKLSNLIGVVMMVLVLGCLGITFVYLDTRKPVYTQVDKRWVCGMRLRLSGECVPRRVERLAQRKVPRET